MTIQEVFDNFRSSVAPMGSSDLVLFLGMPELAYKQGYLLKLIENLEKNLSYAIMGVDSLSENDKFLYGLFSLHAVKRGYPDAMEKQ